MKVNYFCPISEQNFRGYISYKDEKFIYIAEPLLYLWLEKLDSIDLLKDCSFRRYIAFDLFYHEYNYDINSYVSEHFIFDFPILNYDNNSKHGIALFFENFLYFRNYEAIERLKRSFYAVKYTLEKEVLEDILSFLLREYYKDERLKILCSNVLKDIK